MSDHYNPGGWVISSYQRTEDNSLRVLSILSIINAHLHHKFCISVTKNQNYLCKKATLRGWRERLTSSSSGVCDTDDFRQMPCIMFFREFWQRILSGSVTKVWWTFEEREHLTWFQYYTMHSFLEASQGSPLTCACFMFLCTKQKDLHVQTIAVETISIQAPRNNQPYFWVYLSKDERDRKDSWIGEGSGGAHNCSLVDLGVIRKVTQWNSENEISFLWIQTKTEQLLKSQFKPLLLNSPK